jgi:hypothetical protein
MSTAKLNLKIKEGATFSRTLTWLDERRRAINLTGAIVRVEIRDRKDGLLLMEFTVGNGRLVITPTLGRIQLRLTPAETEAITFSKGVWDLRVEFTADDVRYPVEGNVIVERSVTEP